MARFRYTILSRAVAGREEEFVAWYRDQHIADVCRMPGVISGQLFRMDFQRVYDLDEAPQWTLMTIYELEGENPQTIIDALRDASGSISMPACAELDKTGMIQVAGHLIATGGAAPVSGAD
jgi:ferritin-like protein